MQILIISTLVHSAVTKQMMENIGSLIVQYTDSTVVNNYHIYQIGIL